MSSRLRWNNVLNAVTRRGSFTGNSAGVLGPSIAPHIHATPKLIPFRLVSQRLFTTDSILLSTRIVEDTTTFTEVWQREPLRELCGNAQVSLPSLQLSVQQLTRCDMTAGIQPMLITSGLLTVGAAGWTTLKTQFL